MKNKIDSAKWFISAIKQRHDTLMRTMQTILDYQQEYFKDGDKSKLRPMILKDIADRTGLDVSTISRVVNSKYVQTQFGIILLKSLFSEAMQTESGEEVSSYEIKNILQECIDEEDKRHPLTDETLMDILNVERLPDCPPHGGQVPRNARNPRRPAPQTDIDEEQKTGRRPFAPRAGRCSRIRNRFALIRRAAPEGGGRSEAVAAGVII